MMAEWKALLIIVLIVLVGYAISNLFNWHWGIWPLIVGWLARGFGDIYYEKYKTQDESKEDA